MNTALKWLAIIMIVCGCLVSIRMMGANKFVGGTGEATTYITSLTNASSTVGSTGVLVLATSTGRTYASIVNSSTTDAFLNFGRQPIANEGYYLKAGNTFTINENNLYVGPVYARTISGTTTFTVVYDR